MFLSLRIEADIPRARSIRGQSASLNECGLPGRGSLSHRPQRRCPPGCWHFYRASALDPKTHSWSTPPRGSRESFHDSSGEHRSIEPPRLATIEPTSVGMRCTKTSTARRARESPWALAANTCRISADTREIPSSPDWRLNRISGSISSRRVRRGPRGARTGVLDQTVEGDEPHRGIHTLPFANRG